MMYEQTVFSAYTPNYLPLKKIKMIELQFLICTTFRLIINILFSGALAFLAIWHGYHSGYYVSFFCEFLIINFEKQFFPMLDSSTWLQPLLAQNRALSFGASIIGKIYYLFFLPHCFLPFALLKSKRYVPVMLNTYAGIFVFFGTWILWRPLAKMILRPGNTFIEVRVF
jgi:hypothetical protein